ncbi:MAG: FkbM family methyltransferase [Candidatus Hinthialibacter antarcticus]|nr:FkbM family methyltransferase [Candidatus Hinthialibacter antarcticus]
MDSVFNNLFEGLPAISAFHSPQQPIYNALKQLVKLEVGTLFRNEEAIPVDFSPFGDLVFPFFQMGAINSTNLFDLDELIIFSFYWSARNRYKKVADIGANIGLHSVLLSKCGFDVRSYEPDPKHFDILRRNLQLNQCESVNVSQAAVSSKPGETEFIRVVGNTTGSHIAGSKENPYGELERFPVSLEGIGPILEWADFIKLDAEGHEKEILLSTNKNQWENTDAMVEIENVKNAESVFNHFTTEGVGMYAQKIGWQRVENLDQMPTSYHDGSLYISGQYHEPFPQSR